MNVRKSILLGVVLASSSISLHAQTFSVNPSLCSPGSTSATVCVDVTLSPAGEDPAFFYIRDTNVNPVGHWISFGSAGGSSVLGTAQIDAHIPTMDTVSYTYGGKTATGYLETSAIITFHGSGYTGTLIMAYTWTYSWTCSGRGCGGTLGWHRHVSGGSLTITH